MTGTLAAKPAKNRSAWRRRQRLVTPLLFIAPAALLFSLFVLYPIAAGLKLSLFHWRGVGAQTWAGLGNYHELLADPVFKTALVNNLIWLALIPAAPVLGLAFALLLDRKTRMMQVARAFFFLPFVLSQAVTGMIFAWFFNADYGLLNAILQLFQLPSVAPLENESSAIFPIIAAHLWPQTAFCMIIYLAGLAGLDPALEQAARLDGAHGWRLLRHVILPQLWPAHFIVAMVCIVSALRSFDLVFVMTRGGPYDSSNVLAFYMYEQAFLNLRYGYAAAIASVLFALAAGCVSFFLWHMLRRER